VDEEREKRLMYSNATIYVRKLTPAKNETDEGNGSLSNGGEDDNADKPFPVSTTIICLK